MPEDVEEQLALGGRTLGAVIRGRREAAGLSRRALCEMTDVGHDTLFSVEQGRRLPNLSTLHKLAVGLNVTARDLLADVYPFDEVKAR